VSPKFIACDRNDEEECPALAAMQPVNGAKGPKEGRVWCGWDGGLTATVLQFEREEDVMPPDNAARMPMEFSFSGFAQVPASDDFEFSPNLVRIMNRGRREMESRIEGELINLFEFLRPSHRD
jgi:hypothetical protein